MGNLTPRQKQIMMNAGFLKREIRAFDKATASDGKLQHLSYHSATFEAMVESRIRYIQRLRKAGWTHLQALKRIARHYRRGGSPFEFLRLEYKPPEPISEYIYARYFEARARISRVMGRAYGRRPWQPQEVESQYPELPSGP